MTKAHGKHLARPKSRMATASTDGLQEASQQGTKRQILKPDRLRSETRLLLLLYNCVTVLISYGGGNKLSQSGAYSQMLTN